MKIATLSGIVILCSLPFFSCKKDDVNSPASFPKQVTISYKVTSSTTNSLTSISFTNETGGLSTVTSPTLPFTKTLTKTVTKYEIVTVGYGTNPAKDVRLEILVNNQSVKSQDNNAVYAAMSYTF